MIAMFDTECYPNYWLLRMYVRDHGHYYFQLNDDEVLNPSQIYDIRKLFAMLTTVSFNGINYDVPMINGALCGRTPGQLKTLNDMIIMQGLKPWQLDLPEWSPADHIDIMEVLPGMASQKQYAGRIHHHTIRDLPYHPDDYLTVEQKGHVFDYCGDDLAALGALYDQIAPQIAIRERLGAKYDVDLRSKSDAQVGETVIKIACGAKYARPNVAPNLKFKYLPPEFIQFTSPYLQGILDRIKGVVFTLNDNLQLDLPEYIKGLTIHIGTSTYNLGIGGLHSTEKDVAHISDDNVQIIDNDVDSYYPTLILNSGKFPPALGETFRDVYRQIRDERLRNKKLAKELESVGGKEYEAAKAFNEGGKIMINGSYGKLGSPYSALFAPEMLIQTTMTGQLSILMLIEWLEFYGIPVISANTDGVVIKCPIQLIPTSQFLIKEWEKRTGLTMESADYKAIYSRDVNNYIAISASGKVKRKGVFAPGSLEAKKNPDLDICADAIVDYLTKGVPIEETIRNCRDIRKFVTIRKVNGGGVKLHGAVASNTAKAADMLPVITAAGWVKAGRQWSRGGMLASTRDAYRASFSEPAREKLGKICRWYYGTNAPGPIVYESNGNQVGRSEGAMPAMKLPESFPDNVDYEWYIRYTREIMTWSK